MSTMGWTRTDNPVPAWDLNVDSSYFVEKWGMGSYVAYHNAEPVGEPRGTLDEAKLAAEDAYLAELQAEYLAAKAAYEDQGAAWGRTMTPGEPVPASIKQAEARVDALKSAGGEGQPGDPPCCQKYGRLHEPAISQPGCRWFTGPTEAELADSAKGLTLGKMSAAQKSAVISRAARALQAELQANAPAIAAVLAENDAAELTGIYNEQEH